MTSRDANGDEGRTPGTETHLRKREPCLLEGARDLREVRKATGILLVPGLPGMPGEGKREETEVRPNRGAETERQRATAQETSGTQGTGTMPQLQQEGIPRLRLLRRMQSSYAKVEPGMGRKDREKEGIRRSRSVHTLWRRSRRRKETLPRLLGETTGEHGIRKTVRTDQPVLGEGIKKLLKG